MCHRNTYMLQVFTWDLFSYIRVHPIVFLHGAIPRLNLWCGEVSGHSINQLA